jgi:hypothetical protein
MVSILKASCHDAGIFHHLSNCFCYSLYFYMEHETGRRLTVTVTLQKVLDRLIEPVGRLKTTVDTFNSGSPDAAVRKVAVVFMATYDNRASEVR